jgi:hypothetical protein
MTIKEIQREKILTEIISERDAMIEMLVSENEKLKNLNAELTAKLKEATNGNNNRNTSK